MGVTAAISAGERKLADRIARAASRVLPGNESLWRPLGHVVSLAAIAAGTRYAMQRGFGMIENREESVEPSFDLPPPSSTLSGSLDSEVPYDTLSKQGRRFVWNAQPAEMIAEVMGEDAIDVIRVYVGLESAETETSASRSQCASSNARSAFDREWLLIDLPTGTGYVNYAAVSVLEMLSRGNCATVAMQYAARPSPLSLDRVDEGRRQARLLIDAISERLRGMPDASRPKVVLFGESLGAWTSQDAFLDSGHAGPRRRRHRLRDLDRDAALQSVEGTGPPRRAPRRRLRADRRLQRHRRMGSDAARAARAHALRHDHASQRRRRALRTRADRSRHPIGSVTPRRWPEIPKGMRWMPNTTFFQMLVDMKNSANVVPGVFAATGHDYRADLLPFFRAVLGITVTDEQMQRLAEVAPGSGTRAKRVGEAPRDRRHEPRRVTCRRLDARGPRARERDDPRTRAGAGARGLRRRRRCGRRRADRCADCGRLVRHIGRITRSTAFRLAPQPSQRHALNIGFKDRVSSPHPSPVVRIDEADGLTCPFRRLTSSPRRRGDARILRRTQKGQASEANAEPRNTLLPAQSCERKALVAQGIEHRFPKPCVAGSNPAEGATDMCCSG